MKWWEALPEKERKGSRPRCVLLMDGSCDEVTERLTRLVSPTGVIVSPADEWMPRGKPIYRNGVWDDDPAKEVNLIKTNNLVSRGIQDALRDWWLAVARSARRRFGTSPARAKSRASRDFSSSKPKRTRTS